MKNYICLLGLTLALFSCGQTENKNVTNQTKFNPQQKENQMSNADRELAIAAKRNELNSRTIADVMFSNDVNLSVLPPAAGVGDMTEALSEKVATKLLQIVTQNGVGGLNNSPGFALGLAMEQDASIATSTVPQKMMVTYNLTYKVGNLANGAVYATHTDKVEGVGLSFEEANKNAVNNIKNTPALQNMLQKASEKIIAWYDQNLETFKHQVTSAESNRNYALAMALLESVPEKAKGAFEYANSRHEEVLKKMQHEYAERTLNELIGSIDAANREYSPKVIACLQMIPVESPEYKEAHALYKDFEKAIAQKELEIKQKAESDSAYVRKLRETNLQRQHEKELVQIEADKIMCKYESEASAKATERAMRAENDNKGFFKGLGSRILNGIDFVADLF